MRKLEYILGIISLLCIYPCASLAQDSTLTREVTVEKDYQPEIATAEIIPIQPSILQEEVEPNPVIYSTFSTPLSIGFNLHPLQAADTRFSSPTPSYGMLDGALGHHNTHLDFFYQIKGGRKFNADICAQHDAYWGKNTLANTMVKGNGAFSFNKVKLYFGLEGDNKAYSLYQRDTLQALYHADAHIGICSQPENHLQFKIQTAYKAFFTPKTVEHQIRTQLNIYWSEGVHKGGVKAYVHNNCYSHATNLTTPIHNIRIQPFYTLNESKIKLEVGVNLDMNIGTGKMLSKTENLSFAPSPHIKLKWLAVPKIFNLHAEIEGGLAKGTLEEELNINRYLRLDQLEHNREPKTYTPIASNLGFMIHPIRTMVIDIYGGYSLYKNDYTMVCDPSTMSYSYLRHDYQRAHIGASLHYHYRDIITINAKGHYYFWKNMSEGMKVYDRPNWDASLRLDVNIDQKWSLYSDNHIEGTRWAYTTLQDEKQDEKLQAIIDLNIGAQYDINRWLNVYLQLGNYLHRKNPIYYGYNTQGCHFLAGVKYIF